MRVYTRALDLTIATIRRARQPVPTGFFFFRWFLLNLPGLDVAPAENGGGSLTCVADL